MKKEDLIKATGASIGEVDEVLKAMRLKTDADDYQDSYVEQIKGAIALIAEKKLTAKDAVKELKQQSQLAKSKGAAISKDKPAAIANSFDLPEDVEKGIDGVFREVSRETMEDVTDSMAARSNHNAQHVKDYAINLTDRIWTEEVNRAFSNPDLPNKIRKAIDLGKSQNSEKNSN